MLYTNVQTAETYDYLEDKFRMAYKWLRETDLENIKPGRYPLLGEDIVANIMEYMTLPLEEARFEGHDQFFDIQYVIAGREYFGISIAKEMIIEERIEENDLIYFKTPEDYGTVLLAKGDMAVVAPKDAHQPKVMAGKPAPVKKAVIKVRV